MALGSSRATVRSTRLRSSSGSPGTQGKADKISLAEILEAIRLLDAASVKPDANGMVYIEVCPYRYGRL